MNTQAAILQGHRNLPHCHMRMGWVVRVCIMFALPCGLSLLCHRSYCPMSSHILQDQFAIFLLQFYANVSLKMLKLKVF